jgi:hypothetical protein
LSRSEIAPELAPPRDGQKKRHQFSMSRVKLDNANNFSLNVHIGYCTFKAYSLRAFSGILEYQFLPLWSLNECEGKTTSSPHTSLSRLHHLPANGAFFVLNSIRRVFSLHRNIGSFILLRFQSKSHVQCFSDDCPFCSNLRAILIHVQIAPIITEKPMFSCKPLFG